MTTEKFTQEEIEELKKEYGAAKIYAYFEVAEKIKEGGICRLASQIEAGTQAMIDNKTALVDNIHKMHKKGDSDQAIADRLNISLVEVMNVLRKR